MRFPDRLPRRRGRQVQRALVSDRHTDGLNTLDAKLTARIDTLQRDLASAKVWALLLYITLAGAMYATLGRTMGWI